MGADHDLEMEDHRHQPARRPVADHRGARGSWEPPLSLRRDDDLVRTVVIGAHLSFCEALAFALIGHGGFAVEAVAAGPTAVTGALEAADVVVLDVELEGPRCLALVEEVVSAAGGPVVLVATTRQSVLWQRAIAAGAGGVVPKTAPLEQLVRSLLAVAGGQVVAPPAALAARGMRTHGGVPVSHLTERELEVLGLCATGLSTARIAERLVVSPNTVRTHIQNVLGKLNAKSRLEAVAYGLATGIIDPPDRAAFAS